MTKPNDELKCCPFCGGEAFIAEPYARGFYVVECLRCSTRRQYGVKSANQAKEIWNTRADIAPTSQWRDIKDASHNEHWILACNDELTHSFVAAWSNRHQCFLDWNGDAIDVLHWQPLSTPKAPPTKDLADAGKENNDE